MKLFKVLLFGGILGTLSAFCLNSEITTAVSPEIVEAGTCMAGGSGICVYDQWSHFENSYWCPSCSNGQD